MDGIDAHTNCNELLALFSTAGTVMQAATISPAANGAPCTAILWFDTPASAASAVELFNDHPYAGTFLEVRPTDVGAATRALSALAEAQTTPPQVRCAGWGQQQGCREVWLWGACGGSWLSRGPAMSPHARR